MWMNCRTAVVLALLSGCDFVPGGGGGGFGGGGGSSLAFTQGFTFVRQDDRNVYLADHTDYQAVAVLTQSGGVHTPSFSRAASRVAYVFGAGASSELRTVAVAGGAYSTVLAADPATDMRGFKSPVYAPDGGQLAFSYEVGTASGIGLIDVDGKGLVSLAGGTQSSLAYRMPSFTADGRFVIAAAGTPGLGPTQIERIAVPSGQVASIANTLGNEALDIANRLALSPDGKKLVFDAHVSTGATRIFVLDLESRAVTKVNDYVGEPGTNDTFPCWLDSLHVAYSSNSGGNDNVYQVGLTGEGRQLLVPKAIEPFFGPVGE
jgi:TolB protein